MQLNMGMLLEVYMCFESLLWKINSLKKNQEIIDEIIGSEFSALNLVIQSISQKHHEIVHRFNSDLLFSEIEIGSKSVDITQSVTSPIRPFSKPVLQQHDNNNSIKSAISLLKHITSEGNLCKCDPVISDLKEKLVLSCDEVNVLMDKLSTANQEKRNLMEVYDSEKAIIIANCEINKQALEDEITNLASKVGLLETQVQEVPLLRKVKEDYDICSNSLKEMECTVAELEDAMSSRDLAISLLQSEAMSMKEMISKHASEVGKLEGDLVKSREEILSTQEILHRTLSSFQSFMAKQRSLKAEIEQQMSFQAHRLFSVEANHAASSSDFKEEIFTAKSQLGKESLHRENLRLRLELKKVREAHSRETRILKLRLQEYE